MWAWLPNPGCKAVRAAKDADPVTRRAQEGAENTKRGGREAAPSHQAASPSTDNDARPMMMMAMMMAVPVIMPVMAVLVPAIVPTMITMHVLVDHDHVASFCRRGRERGNGQPDSSHSSEGENDLAHCVPLLG